MSFQSDQEILRVCADWLQNFAPADMLQAKENGKVLSDYIYQYLGGIFTVSNLTAAEKALRVAGKLFLTPQPPAKTADQLQAEAIAEQSNRWQKQHYEAISQNKERDFSGEANKKAEADKRAKELADVEKTIQAVINNYSCSRTALGQGAALGGSIDYSRTEQFRRDLRKIEVQRNGKRDAVLTLKAVREAISNLPG